MRVSGEFGRKLGRKLSGDEVSKDIKREVGKGGRGECKGKKREDGGLSSTHSKGYCLICHL